MKKKNTGMVIVDSDNLPPLTDEDKALLAALDKMQDSEIDYSDAPPIDFSKVVAKRPTTVRIDADLLAWLKGSGRHWEFRMNDILRREMEKDNAGKLTPEEHDVVPVGAEG